MTRESKEQTRKRNIDTILRAAEMAFAEHGYRGASISMIARMAELPKSNVTYYFESKELLYKEVLSNICLLWLEAGDQIRPENDPEHALTHYIYDKMELARTRPYGSKVWANEIIHGAAFINPYLSSTVRDWVIKHSEVIEHWIANDQLRPIDPRTLFYMIWSTTQHYADFDAQIKILNDRKPLSEEQWAEAKQTVARTITHGLRPVSV